MGQIANKVIKTVITKPHMFNVWTWNIFFKDPN